jgi:hypothetical protein
MAGDWIKLHRKTLDSQVFANDALFKVWAWTLLKANHKATWVSIVTGSGTTEIKLEPGQFVFGRKQAAKELRMPEGSVYVRMKKLEKLQNLNITSNSHFSVITICNWGTYQTDDATLQQALQHPDSNHITSRQQPHNTDKKILPTEESICSEAAQPPSEPTSDSRSSGSEDLPPSKKSSRMERAQEAESAIFSFPVVGKKSGDKATEWHLVQSMIDALALAYPGVNVLAECRKALLWCNTNPSRRKTFQGMPEFLRRWMAGEQNRGGISIGPKVSDPTANNKSWRERRLEARKGSPDE